MREKEFVQEGINKAKLEEYLEHELERANYSHAEITKTPVSTKITIYAQKPGLVIGRGGSRVKELTETFERKFDIENPQVDVVEVEEPDLDAEVVAKNVAQWLEKGGHPKLVGNTYLQRILEAGALGAQIVISGKLSGSFSRSEKFTGGYIKRCGEAARRHVEVAEEDAILPPGAIGVKVRIMKSMPEYMQRVKRSEEEMAQKIEIDIDHLVGQSVSEVKDTVREFNLDPDVVIEKERAGEDRSTLVSWLEGRQERETKAEEQAVEEEEEAEEVDLDAVLDGTVKEAKSRLEDVSAEMLDVALEKESSGKGRKTLVEWIEKRLEQEMGEAGAEEAEVEEVEEVEEDTEAAEAEEAFDPAPIVSGTVADAKEQLDDLSEEELEAVLEAEKDGKDRKTLKEAIEKEMGEE